MFPVDIGMHASAAIALTCRDMSACQRVTCGRIMGTSAGRKFQACTGAGSVLAASAYKARKRARMDFAFLLCAMHRDTSETRSVVASTRSRNSAIRSEILARFNDVFSDINLTSGSIAARVLYSATSEATVMRVMFVFPFA